MFMLAAKRLIVKYLHREVMVEPAHLGTQMVRINFPWGGSTQVSAYFLSFTTWFLASFYKQVEYSGNYKVSALLVIVRLWIRNFSYWRLNGNIKYHQLLYKANRNIVHRVYWYCSCVVPKTSRLFLVKLNCWISVTHM